MTKLQPKDILRFGKNYGLTLGEVYQFQPSYIEWAILKKDDFKIDMEEFECLPAPTTIGYNPRRFEDRSSSGDIVKNINGKLEIDIEEIKNLMDSTDVYNQALSALEIKEMIEDGEIYVELNNFKFPKRIREANDAK